LAPARLTVGRPTVAAAICCCGSGYIGPSNQACDGSGVLQRLHPRRPIPEVSFYTDDVVVFCHVTPNDLDSVKAIFQLFGKASGLQLNYTKSMASLLTCTLKLQRECQLPSDAKSWSCRSSTWESHSPSGAPRARNYSHSSPKPPTCCPPGSPS
jgi:hypothetical protein